MVNKIISIVDFDNFKQQNAEVLFFSNILEKKYDSVSILDLNNLDDNHLLKKIKFTEKAQFLTANIFDITSYCFASDDVSDANKALKMAKTLSIKNKILLINTCSTQYFVNTDFLNISNEIIIFTKLNDDTPNNLLSFFMMHKIEKQKIHLFVINSKQNIQSDKSFLSLRKQLAKSNLILHNINDLPYIESIDEIKKVDPWCDIYKEIKNNF